MRFSYSDRFLIPRLLPFRPCMHLRSSCQRFKKPVTDEEACALVKLFGSDDCVGLAWTLLHLIETAPGWPIESALIGLEGEWIRRLRERAEE